MTCEFKDGCAQRMSVCPRFLQWSEINCLSLCSEDCLKILDSASTSFQLKIKEAMHIHKICNSWEIVKLPIIWDFPTCENQLLPNKYLKQCIEILDVVKRVLISEWFKVSPKTGWLQTPCLLFAYWIFTFFFYPIVIICVNLWGLYNWLCM